MPTYPGRKGVVYISTTGAGTASNVLHLDKWAVDSTTDKIEVTSFGDPNKTSTGGDLA
jgi:hypothetical protein